MFDNHNSGYIYIYTYYRLFAGLFPNPTKNIPHQVQTLALVVTLDVPSCGMGQNPWSFIQLVFTILVLQKNIGF
jgi:hypothetical protein